MTSEQEQIADLAAKLHSCREELAAARLELDMFSMTDPVTGLSNLHGVMDAIRDRLERLTRNGTPVAVIGVSFPELAAVDARRDARSAAGAVRHSASVLNAVVRALDRVGRLDSTTFSVVLDDPDPRQLDSLIGRIQRAMASLPLRFADETIELGAIVAAVTLSGPVAIAPEEVVAHLHAAIADSTAASPQIRALP